MCTTNNMRNASSTSLSAKVFDVHRNSTNDGPGIRTTVFLKGCPLNCQWCHNPESRRSRPEVWWFGQACIGCGRCVAACGQGALSQDESGISIDRNRCTGCQQCAGACPSRAMRAIGESRTLNELIEEVESDKPWYDNSGGGVTLSGGEPCAQPDFSKAFLSGCQERGLHTALDTSGQVPPEVFSEILDFADCVLFDLKHADELEHKKMTGVSLKTIHTNVREVASRARAGRLKLWIRTPLVPGAAAKEPVLKGIGQFIARELDGVVERWELCSFNPSCSGKYRRLGLQWPYEGEGLMEAARVSRLVAVAAEACGNSEIVRVQGVRASGKP